MKILSSLWSLLTAPLFFFCKRSTFDAKGKVLVITGASSGIGKELALQYARERAVLVLFARREKELKEVAHECKMSGATDCVVVVGDVTVDADCKRLMESASGINGAIDCVILNAGVSMGNFFEDCDDMAMFRRLTEVNYHSCICCTMCALPFLKKSKEPKIVVVSSLAGKIGAPTRTGYCGTKFALHGFFEALRTEVGPKYGMQVTLVCPGAVVTEINSSRLGKNPAQLNMEQAMPVHVAANIIRKAIARGNREEIMTLGGKIGVVLRFFFPALFEHILLRKFVKENMSHH